MTPLDRYVDFVLRRRWLLVGAALLVMIAAAAGIPGITYSGSYRVLFGKDNPHLLAFDKLQDTYSASRSALIAIAPREGTVFTRDTLKAIEELTEAAWQTPHSVRVNSLTNYYHSEAVGDDLAIAPLVEGAASFSDAELSRVRNIALSQPELVGQLVAEDGRAAGVSINFALSKPEDPALARISDHLSNLLDDARDAHPHLGFFLTGNVIQNQTFTEAAEDMGILLPIVFVVILTMAALLLRSFYPTLSIAIVLVFLLLSTMGVAGWFGTMLTPVNASVPIIIVTVSVADSIHIIMTALASLRRGLDKNRAIAESLRDNLYPVFLTSATTSVGFLSLNTSNAPSFHVLGNMVALGMLFAFIYSVTLLPIMLSILPLRATPARTGKPPFFDRFGNFVVERRRLLLWSGILVVAALAAGVSRNEFSDNWLHHFDERYTFRTDTDFIIENLTGLDRLEYSLNSGRDGGISDPHYMRQVEAFAQWYRTQPKVHHVQSFTDIMKRINQNMHGDDPAFYRLPDDSELAAQFLLLYELSLPFGADLNDRMDLPKSATRMTVVLENTSTRDHLDIDERARNWLRAHAPELEGPASGFTMITARMSNRNIINMLAGTILATTLITLILMLVFRNIRVGLICLVPNFVPALMAFGLWGYLVGKVGIGASIVTAIAIGIIVDDTIHFLTRYLRNRRQGKSSSEAVRATFRAVGPALCVTTVMLTAGFLVFSSSGYEPSWALGILVAITIVFALIADLVLLPALLMAIDRKSH